ncbi:alpha/beta fold hydrolase [Panacagrimonas sp.]|uniref:alpha/beta fold hydrolase n=1 Tax=Panacagrimonas sp. TaxID=2480088 RepID=UPI003B517757
MSVIAKFAAVEGAGPRKVLVLHGWALDSGVWLTTRALSNTRDFTWAYLDFPAYGVNRAMAPAADVDGMAQAALAAVDELGWSSFAVLGHSMGGATALRVATLRPQSVTAVAAVTPVSPGGTPLDADTFAAFDAAWADPAAAIRGHLSPGMQADDLTRLVDRNRASMDRPTWTAYLKNWTSPDFIPALADYAGAVTLFYGQTDPFVTAAYLQPTLKALRKGRLVALDDAGHYPMIESAAASQAAFESALRL